MVLIEHVGSHVVVVQIWRIPRHQVCHISTISLTPDGRRRHTTLCLWTLAPLLSAGRVYYDDLWAGIVAIDLLSFLVRYRGAARSPLGGKVLEQYDEENKDDTLSS